MLAVEYSSDFVRRFKKLDSSLQEEALERIAEFKNLKNHVKLRVHKLKGSMAGLRAFSVNYRIRIVFEYAKNKKTAYLLDIGDHSIYE